jgi:spermidine synthase
MGSTLPLLVAYLVQRTENVGASIGSLYAVNTVGSGVACFFASLFLMRTLGEAGSAQLAAGLNLIVGSTAILLASRERGNSMAPLRLVPFDNGAARCTIAMPLGMMFAAAAGFIALAYEILWYHIYSFTSGATASCFATLLGSYLIGVAYGSLAVHDFCRKKFKTDLAGTIRGAAVVVCLGTIAGFLVVPATVFSVSTAHIPYQLTFAFVTVAAALLGAAFPILCHASIDPSDHVGTRLSYLYLSNIIGSALGSFLIGFVVLDHISTVATSWLLLTLGLCMALTLAALARPLPVKGILIGSLSTFLILAVSSDVLFSSMFERLLLKAYYRPGIVFRNLVENRSGIIAVTADEKVIGGGVYDGHFNIDPVNASNGIFRAYAIAAFHPNPRHVLVIGLSSGSWTQILVNHPKVEDTTVVEINPGYLSLIQQRPIVSSLLHNPKVHVEIDDGRRWLVSHPERKFDFILMNSTFNWRANTTNLLSVEFLRLVRKHLNPGGILYYNTTDSGRVQFTGAEGFPYALRVSNFLAVSDSPIEFNRARFKKLLENYRIDGHPVLDLTKPDHRACVDWMVSLPQQNYESSGQALDRSIEDRASLLRRLQGMRLVTDDNMGTEWQ